jgi:hypothetical protein
MDTNGFMPARRAAVYMAAGPQGVELDQHQIMEHW